MSAFKKSFGTKLNKDWANIKPKHLKKKLTDETTPSRLKDWLKVDIEQPLELKTNNQTYVYNETCRKDR